MTGTQHSGPGVERFVRLRHEGARPRRGRRRLAGRDAHDRPPPGGLRQPGLRPGRPCPGGVPRLPARRAPARPDAARQGRHRRLQGDPCRVGRPDRHAHRQGRHRRRGRRPRVRGRRLRRQAVQAQGAGGPDPGPGPPPGPRGRRSRSASATSPSTWPGTRSPATATRSTSTPLEFDLLVCLARKPWQVFTREVLLEQVWGYRHAADTRLVNVHVQRLRSKVEHDPENPEIVVTVRGVGYKAGTA